MSSRKSPSVVEMLTVMYGRRIAIAALIVSLTIVSAGCSLLPSTESPPQVVSPNLLVKCQRYQSDLQQPVRVSDVYAEVRRLVSQHDECSTRHNHLVEQLEAE